MNGVSFLSPATPKKPRNILSQILFVIKSGVLRFSRTLEMLSVSNQRGPEGRRGDPITVHHWFLTRPASEKIGRSEVSGSIC